MSEQPRNNPERVEAERRIKQRLHLSLWIQRGFLAIAMAAGLSYAYGPETIHSAYNANAATTQEDTGPNTGEALSLTALLAAVAGAPLERVQSRRKSQKIVDGYRQTRGIADLGDTTTHLSIENGNLNEESRSDHRALDNYGTWVPYITTLAPLTGAMGTLFLARENLTHKLEAGVAVPANGLGIGFLAIAAVAVAGDGVSLKERLETYQRRLDNIDGGLSFDS